MFRCQKINLPGVDSCTVTEIKEKIRIHHECEGGIEKSVLSITDWHHKPCQVMTNGDREGQIFLSPLTHIMDSYSCPTLSTTFYNRKNMKRLRENPDFAEMRHGDVILTLQ